MRARGIAWRLGLCALAAAALCTACGTGAGLSLRVEGSRLVAADGATVRLLGVNRSGAEYSCVAGRGVFDGPTGRDAIAVMKSWRVNAVRIPLNEDCWLGINGAPARYSGARYRAAIAAYVARLHRAGLYVVLDLHWNAPGSALAVSQQPMADADHSIAFWSSVARTFKADPAVAFDLYNEPNGVSWQCWRDGCTVPSGQAGSHSWQAAGMQALVDAVRSAGATQPVIVAGLGSGADLSAWWRYRPRDPAGQLVAGLHAYSFNGCVTAACWARSAGPLARRVPVVATEIGQTGCSDLFLKRFMAWADRVGVSYLAWAWNPAGCSAPSLISDWAGRPTAYGAGLREHLLMLAGSGTTRR